MTTYFYRAALAGQICSNRMQYMAAVYAYISIGTSGKDKIFTWIRLEPFALFESV